MSKHAEVFTIEDNWDYISLTKRCMELFGHAFIGCAHDLAELRNFLDNDLGKIRDIRNSVFLFDANWHGASSNGLAGKEAVALVRSKIAEDKMPWLIGRSGYNVLEHVDFNWLKSDYQIHELPDLIDALPRR